MVAFRAYYELIKPGRTIANGMTALAGYLFAADGNVSFSLLLATVGGISLIVASACAFNNYFDRGIDSGMERTKHRALVEGIVKPWHATVYAAVLGVAGFALLASFTNMVTVVLGIIGMVDYLVLYGVFKRRSKYSTLIGSICGATPIAAGFTTVAGTFDHNALLLFLLMVFWQMPHFYAIAIYRKSDYKAANLPVWSVKRGVTATKLQIAIYSFGFLAACVAMGLSSQASKSFLIIMGVLAALWTFKSLQGFRTPHANAWARGMFGFSLIVLLAMCTVLSLNAWLP
jgi:protoheme IX farnesyltransferase